jgi:phenylalanyl-tRNA synthetase beta chain
VRLANPLDWTVPYLRTSLIPGLIDVTRRNLSRGLTDLALYELGLVFLPEAATTYGTATLPAGASLPSDAVLAELNAGIPPQPRHVGALFVGNAIAKQPGQAPVPAGIEDALIAAQQVADAVGIRMEPIAGSHQALHPGRTAALVIRTPVGEQRVGYAGELLPALAEHYGLPRVVAVLELDLDALISAARGDIVASAISVFPAATQDLSLVVDRDIPAGSVRQAVIDGAGDLLESARLVDDYRGPGIGEGVKSLTFALRFRAADRTLTAAEASDAKLAGADRARELFGATVRE